MEKSHSQASGSATLTGIPHKPTPGSTYVEQEWQRVDKRGTEDDLEWAVAEGDNLEEWECVACAKTFRSEAAWDSHERSKKHMKEIEKLRREMSLDEEELGLTADMEPLEKSDASEPPEPTTVAVEDLDIFTTGTDPPPTSPLASEAFNERIGVTSDTGKHKPQTKRKKKVNVPKESKQPPEPLTKTERKGRDLVNITRSLDKPQESEGSSRNTEQRVEADDGAKVEQGSTSGVAEGEGERKGPSKREKRRTKEAKKALENSGSLQVSRRSCSDLLMNLKL